MQIHEDKGNKVVLHPSKNQTGLFICLILTFVVLLSGDQTFAQESSDPDKLRKELDALEAEISKFREMLESTKSQRSELESSLELNEKEISEILNKINEIQQKLVDGEDKISSLILEQKELEGKKKIQQRHIGKQIRAAHKLGTQHYLKVVLNQEDPNQLARMMKYYDYFNRARTEQIDAYEVLLRELDDIELNIKEQNQVLDKRRTQLERQETSLISLQREKKKVLSALVQQINETGDLIEKRTLDREHLASLLERIIAGIVNLSAPEDAQPFADMRGNMLLPVNGDIRQRFGSGRNEGKLHWDGVFIEADEGEPVHSIHYGRVVFSDWLRGFGLLLIINHGEGYMSLYGHNQVLYRETGDWVAAGELIANVGNTGGQQRSGLYFEIRSAGIPSDPQLWCQARPLKTTA